MRTVSFPLRVALVASLGLAAAWAASASDDDLALPRREGVFLPYACESAFGNLKFWDPVFVTSLPDDSGRMVVVERCGTIQLVDQREGAWTKSLFADLRHRVVLTKNGAEEGLLGVAFHPEYAVAGSPHRGELFLSYVSRRQGEITNRLSRCRCKDRRLDAVDVESEQVLIDQPDRHEAHNGGGVAFGPDGMLYLSRGDDFLPAPIPHPQRIDGDLFSGILRLDVDCQGGDVSHPPPRQPETGRTAGYFIPNDNPFVGREGALEEFYAIGLRNPWRFSFDRATGRMYAGDVGGSRREEINLVASGSNCQWNYAEGTIACRSFSPTAPLRPQSIVGVETPPLFEYPRASGLRCVIGGYVYRGKKFPEIEGRYIYADQFGQIFSLELSADGTRAGANTLLASVEGTGVGVSSLGEDAAGELYFCKIGDLATETGVVYRLRRTRPDEQSTMPQELSATGLFADWSTLQPRKALVPYDVRVPFWSDGADKRRWIIVPPGQQVQPGSVPGKLSFPPGTALVKHFEIAMDERSPDKRRSLETRILICDDEGGTFGAAYRWSPDGKQTHLVTFAESEELVRTLADGSTTTQSWVYPGRLDCAMCHNVASGGVLGFTLRQLECAQPSTIPADQSQLGTFIRMGLLSSEVVIEALHEPGAHLIPLDDESAPLEYRVRSYLDVNCSMCHNPNRTIAALDARIVRPLGEQGLVDGATFYHGDLGAAARIIAPGDVANSVLHLRLTSTDMALQMPPVGRSVVDRFAVEKLTEWIRSLPPTAAPAPVARDDLSH